MHLATLPLAIPDQTVAGGLLLLLGLGLLLLAVHPFTTYPLSLRLLSRARPRTLQPRAPVPGSVALCVCAYNEEPVIAAKIANMLAMRAALPELDILVYVDAASDRTAEILRRADGLRVVVARTRQGKTHGMNTLVGMTSAELIVFSDANVCFAPDALPHLIAPFADPEVGAVCGHLVYTEAGAPNAGAPAASISATGKTGSRYWRLEERIKALESATGSVMGADGSIFAIRRRLHHAPPPDLIDDMFVSFSVLCGGGRIVRADDALAYEATVSRPGEEFARKIRIACQAFNVHRALWPELRRMPLLDRYKYVSHKLLRWLTIYLLTGAAACLLGGLALVGHGKVAALLLLAVPALLAVVGRARGGKLAMLRDVLAAFLATGIGVRRSLAGERFQTWNPPASARDFATALPRE